METIKVKFEKFENTDKDFVRQYADTIEAEEARKKLGFDGFVVMAAFSEYIEVVFYKKEKKTMKQLRLDKICEIIENNKLISKHLAPSGQTIRLELGFDPKIIVWEDSVTAYVDIDRNVFKKTIQKLKQEYPELIQDIWFHKSDGSCSSWLVFKLNRIEVEE